LTVATAGPEACLKPTFDVVAFGAHPDDLEAVMGGTAVKLARKNLSVLFVDLCEGEPARHAVLGERHNQAVQAAKILGVERVTLSLQDRMIRDTLEARMQVAKLLREYRPRMVFTTAGAGVHPDHKAATEIVTHGVFYARLPKWEQVAGGECLKDTEPLEIQRLFFGHCRMEPAWDRFDFAVDISDVYDLKIMALQAYQSVFSGEQATLLEKYSAEDCYIGSLVGVRYAEAFRARSPLLVAGPEVFLGSRFG
jgi:bacillithiol biosynthesis deacetylase BshB1